MHGATPPKLAARRSPLSTGEAAALVGCHPTTILRAIQEGELRAFRLGPNGDHRIRAKDLQSWKQPAHRHEETTHATL